MLSNFFDEMKSYAENTVSGYDSLRINSSKEEWYAAFGFLQNESWADLGAYATSRLSAADAKLQAYASEQDTINAFIESYYSYTSELEVMYNSVDPTLLLQESAISELIDQGVLTPETVGQYEQINQFTFGQNFSDFFDSGKAWLEYTTKGLALQYRMGIATRAFLRAAYHIANINTGAGGTDGSDPDNAYYYYRNELEQKLGQLKSAMDSELGANTAATAESVVAWISSTIDDKLIPIVNTLHQQRENGTTIAIERGLLKISKLYKIFSNYEASLSLVAFSARWDSRLEYHEGFFASFVQNADNLSVNLPDFSGSDTTIGALANNPNDYNNQAVVVTGKVVGKENIDDGGDQVSVLILEDDGGNTVKVASKYMYADTQGVPVDSFTEANGIFLAGNPDFLNGEPCIKANRESLSGSMTSSFDSWLRFQTRDVYAISPNYLNVATSLEKGNTGFAFLLINDALTKNYAFNKYEAVMGTILS
ncbi:MAG: hypothetical protein AAFZ63_17875 [Bacteroidota bacterium]